MTKCLQTVIMTKARNSRLEQVGNTHCHKCSSKFKINEQMIKKKKKGGNHRYYHPKCYERIFI